MPAYATSMMYVKTFCQDMANIGPDARFSSYVSAGWTPIVDLAGFPGMTPYHLPPRDPAKCQIRRAYPGALIAPTASVLELAWPY